MDSITAVKYGTVCQLNRPNGKPCGQRVEEFAMDIPIIGEVPSHRAEKFMRALGGHTAAKHPTEFQQIQNIGMQFSAYLIGKVYTTEDQNLILFLNSLRYHFHQMTRRVHVTDAHMLDVIAGMGFTKEDGAPILKAMQELREMYETEGVPQTKNPPDILVSP